MDVYDLNKALFEAFENWEIQSFKTLLHQGADPDAPHHVGSRFRDNRFGVASVRQMASSRDKEYHFDSFANPWRYSNSYEPVYWCSEIRQGEALYQAVKNIDCPLEAGTNLRHAVEKNYLEVVDEILKRKKIVNEPGIGGRTLLITAAVHGSEKLVSLLLTHGANPNMMDDLGETALHCSGESIRKDRIPFLLLENGADPNIADKNGKTPLHNHCANGEVDVIQELLKHGANPNARTSRGCSPLHMAVMQGHQGTAECLLEAGARTDITYYEEGKKGITVWGMAGSRKWNYSDIKIRRTLKEITKSAEYRALVPHMPWYKRVLGYTPAFQASSAYAKRLSNENDRFHSYLALEPISFPEMEKEMMEQNYRKWHLRVRGGEAPQEKVDTVLKTGWETHGVPRGR